MTTISQIDDVTPAATVTTDLEYAQQYLAEAETVGEKIKALGATPLTPDEFMTMVNAGLTLGHDMDFLNQRFSNASKDLTDLKAGLITPRSILGKGARKNEAVAWLETSVAQTLIAIKSGGIMATVNASNYLSQAKKQLRELSKTSMTDAQINEELETLKIRGLELDKIFESRPWNEGELAEIYTAAERDKTLRSQLAARA